MMHQDQKSSTPMKFEPATAHHRYRDVYMREAHRLMVNYSWCGLRVCKWDEDKVWLDESEPKILYMKCSRVWFKPWKPEDFKTDTFTDTPIYKTSIRKGVLMTSGHSTNFVLLLRMPTRLAPNYWVKRGVIIFLGTALEGLDDWSLLTGSHEIRVCDNI